MNARTLLLICGLMILATANAQQPQADPLLIGDNPQAITAQTIKAIDSLVHTLGLPPEDARLWMLRRFDQGEGRVWIEACLWPRVLTPRLVRTRIAACNNFPPPDIRHGSPVVAGWSLANERTEERVFIAPADRLFTTSGPFTDRIVVAGDLTDEDLIAVVDVFRQLHPTQGLCFISSTGGMPGFTQRAICDVSSKTADGHHAEWTVELGKKGMDWTVVKNVKSDEYVEEIPPLNP